MIQTEYGLTPELLIAEVVSPEFGTLSERVSNDGCYLIKFTKDGEPVAEDLARVKAFILARNAVWNQMMS